ALVRRIPWPGSTSLSGSDEETGRWCLRRCGRWSWSDRQRSGGRGRFSCGDPFGVLGLERRVGGGRAGDGEEDIVEAGFGHLDRGDVDGGFPQRNEDRSGVPGLVQGDRDLAGS